MLEYLGYSEEDLFNNYDSFNVFDCLTTDDWIKAYIKIFRLFCNEKNEKEVFNRNEMRLVDKNDEEIRGY